MKKNVEVTFVVAVEVDEEKFTPQFMREFRQVFYRHFNSLDDHIAHIAQLRAREILNEFTEGYGQIAGMGISAEIIDQHEQVQR